MASSFNKQANMLMIARRVFAVLITVTLMSCGGGGGSAGGTGAAAVPGGTPSSTSTAATSAVTLALTDSTTGAVSNSLSNGTLLATATVLDATGAPVANTVVTFTLSGTIAVLTPASGTALTNASGVAQIGIQSARLGAGAVSVTAAATVGTTAVNAQAAFQVGATTTAAAAVINFVSTSPANGAIVIKGAGGNGRTEVALVTFKVVDATNNGTGNKVVNFSTQSSQPVSLGSATGTTNADGTVSVAVNSGTLPTTVRVIATVAGTTISTISDTVTVTTGLPVQTAFSISQEKFFVEGLNFDNVLNKITILAADANGQTVADGTQVVFTTDSGAIVGTNGSFCLTVAGACTVNWRSQLPRLSSGIATVTATATNGTTTLSASTKFYYSGSFARMFLLNASGSRVSPANDITVDLGSSCAPLPVNIEIADVNNNPLPEGTALSIINTNNASATIAPDKVINDGRAILPNGGGTIHQVVITPGTNCVGTGTTASQGIFNISAKTPLSVETLARVVVKFKAP